MVHYMLYMNVLSRARHARRDAEVCAIGRQGEAQDVELPPIILRYIMCMYIHIYIYIYTHLII